MSLLYRTLKLSEIRSALKILNRIPLQYKKTFFEGTLALNIKNEKFLTVFLILWNVILILIDIFKYSYMWDVVPSYKYLFIAHIIPLIVFPVTLVIFITNRVDKENYNFMRAIHYINIAFTALWCSFLSINSQLVHGQISAYIIGSFCMASLIILHPTESIVVFSSICAITIIGFLSLYHTQQVIISNIVNFSFCASFAFLVSMLNYLNYVSNFINKKTAEEKTLALASLNSSLDKIVTERTNELNKSTEYLIQVIKNRHALELQALKSRLEFEEKEKRLNDEVELGNMKANFFTNISHEFKTPISVILSAEKMLEVLSDKLENRDGSKQFNKYTHIIKQNCYRLLRLASNMIDITRIDSGNYNLKLRNCDIIKLVEDITLSVAKYVEGKHISLVFDTEIEEKLIACDPEKIERVMLNLLSNAIKFTPENGSIFVNVFENDAKVFISVKDTGIGIPSNLHTSVFKRFFQADTTLSRSNEGSGIGLSITKSIVELHNGRIYIESEVGQGSKFIIELPSTVIEEKKLDQKADSFAANQYMDKINIEFSDIYF